MKICLLLLLPLTALACTPDRSLTLQHELEQLFEDFDGRAGVYVRHLTTGEEVAIAADSLFPTASMIKVPIMLAVFDSIERGELSYDQTLMYADSLRYPGEDLLGSFRDGEEVQLSKLVMLMLTMSDNTASLWLQDLGGTGTAINPMAGPERIQRDAHELAHRGAEARLGAVRLGTDHAERNGGATGTDSAGKGCQPRRECGNVPGSDTDVLERRSPVTASSLGSSRVKAGRGERVQV